MGLQSSGMANQRWAGFVSNYAETIVSFPEGEWTVSELDDDQWAIWKKMNNWGMLENHGIEGGYYSGPTVWSVDERVVEFAEQLSE